MHEWALAESVISAVTEIADKEKLKKVLEVKIVVGELQQIDISIVKYALSQLKSGILKNAKFTIKVIGAELKCRVCDNMWEIKKKEFSEDISEAIHFVPEIAHSYIKCPKCGSPDFDIVKGRGIYVEKVRGVK
jgi:hydrogenase nickel incorporation protein HypA/HybF